jgi:uncharacterized Zn finger protein (UPF0148 family)
MYCCNCEVFVMYGSEDLDKENENTTNQDTGKVSAKDEEQGDEEDSWTPPSAEEMREIERRRAQTNRASSKMGEKLLLGWKMLNASCSGVDCNTPLLEDKQGRVKCVKDYLLYTVTHLIPLLYISLAILLQLRCF